MDFQRLFLIIAIAAVGYILILKWNEDYHQLPTPVSQTQNQLDQQPPTSPNAVPDSLPQENSTIPQEASSVPSVEQNTTLTTETVATDRLIQIRTDVLSLMIDLKGGDIVEVMLPKYPVSLEQKETPFVLLERSDRRVYIAQSGLIGQDGPDNPKNNPERPLYQASANQFELEANQDSLSVDLTYQKDNVTFTKRFTLKRGDYAVKQDILIQNQSAKPWQGRFFAEIKRDNSPDPSLAGTTRFNTYLGPAFRTNTDKYVKYKFKKIDDGNFKETVNGGWVAMVQHYFLSAWVPDPNVQHLYQTRKSGNQYYAGLISPSVVIEPGKTQQISANFYAGPKIQDHLNALSDGLELTVDYGILWFIAKPLFKLLNFLHQLLGNWGISIIILTLLVKLAFFWLSARSYKSMANMRRVQPKLMQIRERFSGDRQKMAAEMMGLYRKEKINPMGGCLPIIVQMPVFLSLYWVLLESVELRQAPFFGWIHDLSIKDPFFILPLLMGGTMFLQMSLNPTPPDPMQARVMKLMPIIFTFLFLWFPAGLVLYWLVNNVLSISQQWVITRSIEKQGKKA